MGRFNNKATQILGNIFRFLDSRANISEIDLTGPIQPVFDLSRGSGLGRASDFGVTLGLVGIELNMAHVGAGALFNKIDELYAVEADFFGVPEGEIWIWLMEIGGYCSSQANFATVQMSIRDADIQGTKHAAGEGMLLWSADQAGNDLFELGGPVVPVFNTDRPSVELHLPYLITPGGQLKVASTAVNGAVTISVTMRIWVGPRYVMPPGVA